MGYYKDTKASGGGGRNSQRFGGPSRSSDRGGFGRNEDREMFKATCSNCGKSCEVPFRPTGAKPVYCNDCFRKMGGSDGPEHNRNDGGHRDGGHRDGGRNDRRENNRGNNQNTGQSPTYPQYAEQFKALNDKLDTIIELMKKENLSSSNTDVLSIPPVVEKTFTTIPE